MKEKTRRKPPRKKAPDTASAEDRQTGGDSSSVLAELRERKEAALADRIQLQTEIMRGDLVLREIVTSAVGGVYSVYRNQFLDVDLSLGAVICAVFGIPENKSGEVRKIMSDLAYGAVKEIMEKITAFIERN